MLRVSTEGVYLEREKQVAFLREHSKVGEFVRLKCFVDGVYRGCITSVVH